MGPLGETSIAGWSHIGGTVGGTAAQITATSTRLKRGFRITADPNNTGKIAIGYASSVTCAAGTANDGPAIAAGTSMDFNANDLSSAWIIGSAAGQKWAVDYV